MARAGAYPVFLKLTGQPVLVVGGGAVGLRKTQGLIACGAEVRVVSPQFCAAFGRLKGPERVRSNYTSQQMRAKQWRLVFAATDVPQVNAQVGADAAKGGIWCCRCDEPAEGDFTGGAMEQIGGIVLAITTGGASPALAKRIREQAVGGIDPQLGELAAMADGWRATVKRSVKDGIARAQLLRRLAGEEMETCVRRGGASAGRRLLNGWIVEAREHAGGTNGK